MPKLTVQFLIDGKQVDEVEAEEPKETDLRDFIAGMKESLSEFISNLRLDPMVEAGFAGLLKDAQERRERRRGCK
jgi:hypothetical protein